ncbi:MAG TPA: hypothetical protein VNI58_05535 [Mariprofundaceae bacterium]|nr:hypothetical protein [Mariprofundaceae bacterium]
MPLASEQPIIISRPDFERMLGFARAVLRLTANASYLDLLHAALPSAARFDPGCASMLMGYDFHLTADGPKLIEINNNAGGIYRRAGHWLAQQAELFDEPLEARLLSMFPETWRSIAIMDEAIREQYMYPEMLAYARLLEADGRTVWLCEPQEISGMAAGLSLEGKRIDAIYNRHTDFYLETEALAAVRQAYLAGSVALNPHPRSYALIGDKSRMVDWWRPGLLERCVGPEEVVLIREVTPETRLLAEMERDAVWSDRNAWMFKPSARHGGKGVVTGRSISRKRFDELDGATTVMQRFVPPSEVTIDGATFKLDVRLYMHGERLIALAGRVWRGQLTNFREPGSGWVSLAVHD